MLFKNTIKVTEYAEITASTNFATVKPTIQRIEEDHLISILGSTLYKSLDTAFTAATDETSLSTNEKALLDKCRKVIGSYLGHYFAPIGEIKFSDSGLRRSETATEKTAFQYQISNFREACLRNGDAASEQLLEFLEEKKESYADWTSSQEFTRYRDLWIKSGKEFAVFFPSHSPYRNYLAMRSKMEDVQEQHIRKAIGQSLFDYLKAKTLAATPAFTEKEGKLMYKLKKAIANYTVSFSIPFLSVRMDAMGITVATTGARASRDADSTRQYAPDAQMSNIILATKDTGNMWLKDAFEYLTANKADFSEWDGADVEETEVTEINNELSGSFGLM